MRIPFSSPEIATKVEGKGKLQLWSEIRPNLGKISFKLMSCVLQW